MNEPPKMKTSMTRNKGQVYSVGNYLMTGRVLGKGHFARVEEATHRIIGKKVAIKIIDLTCIKEEYARRNLHREPRVMARLRHPCIAALYETMMHGPRLYVVMEAACGGDLCAHVLAARSAGAAGSAGGSRGLPESRARSLSAQLVSAVKHMHARGVVHRDLKMENIMLDGTKQFIKIVDFGLSNVWSACGGLRTPCGSLEYAAPELFLDGRRYGPEVDLWSVGVIVYGMVTGSLPFGGTGGTGGAGAGCGAGEGAGRSRPMLRAAIAKGFSRKHRAALAALSPECKVFVQQLLEPNVETRMKIEDAARHRWLRKPGLRLQTHPLADLELKSSRAIARQISELSGQSLTDVVTALKSDPYGSVGGMYNIKIHTTQIQNAGSDMLWTNSPDTPPRPVSPPVYQPHSASIFKNFSSPQSNFSSPQSNFSSPQSNFSSPQSNFSSPQSTNSTAYRQSSPNTPKPISQSSTAYKPTHTPAYKPISNTPITTSLGVFKNSPSNIPSYNQCPQTYKSPIQSSTTNRPLMTPTYKSLPSSPAYNQPSRPVSTKLRVVNRPLTVRKPLYIHDNGDGEPRLQSIDEHSKLDVSKYQRGKIRTDEERLKLRSCPERTERRAEFYRRAGDGLPSWRATGVTTATSARILLQSNATTIKRASLGNIVSPHSSSNSHCKSDRAVPVGFYSRSTNKESTTPLQRLRRTAPIK